MSEAEPRRSVRSTKGQHKALDPLDTPLESKRRSGKKASKKQAEPEPVDEEEEEIIRCVCGATSQDTDDPDDPWIACDECHAWQHNVCVGMSVFDEDLEAIEYYCEVCKPEAHKELLDGLAKGKKVWEARRQEYMAEKAAEKQKKKAPKKGKKRQSEIPDDARSSHAKSSASPAPVPEKKAKGATAKRKERHDSADTASTKVCRPLKTYMFKIEGVSTDFLTQEPSKLRKVSEDQAVPVPHYEPPADLPDTIAELPAPRQGSATVLQKSLDHAIKEHEKKTGYNPADGVSNESRAARLAIAIERAVHDGPKENYSKQCRSLGANLKSNLDLIARILNHTLTPPMLAVMTSDELQTEKMQQETAAAKERSVRQSVIATDDAQGPRYRRTHKGDELIDDGSEMTSLPQRQLPKAGNSSRAQQPHSRKPSGEAMRVDTQQSPTNFDINKVFSSVKSPTAAHRRRPSGPAPAQGAVEDPDVDRLLEDDAPDSPPYSPTEEADPDVVWRGQLIMAATADFQATAKHIAGANLVKTLNLPWATLLPRKLNVGGRIAMTAATEYLCGLRWSTAVDLVVVSLAPASEAGKDDFDRLYNYFTTRERWAVIGDKGHANVKDTYLVPVPAGTGNQPEFLLNLEDNFLPHTRSENTLLLVIVYRNDETTMQKVHGPEWNAKSSTHSTIPTGAHASPSPAPNAVPQRSMSSASLGYSPTAPHNGGNGFQPPQPGSNAHGQHYAPQQPTHQPGVQSQAPMPGQTAEQAQAQAEGEARARSILGPFASAQTLVFLMPHAHQMSVQEWQIIRRVLEREPRARDDLVYLGHLISRESDPHPRQQQQQQQVAQAPHPQPAQQSPNPPNLPAPHQQPGLANTPTPSQTPGVSPGRQMTSSVPPSQPPRQTPISLPPIAGMPASVHQSYQQAQAQAQARNVQPPAAPPA